MSRIHEASKRIGGEPVEPRVPSNLERYALEQRSKPEETPRESRVSNRLMFSSFRSAGAVGVVDRLRHWIGRSRVRMAGADFRA